QRASRTGRGAYARLREPLPACRARHDHPARRRPGLPGPRRLPCRPAARLPGARLRGAAVRRAPQPRLPGNARPPDDPPAAPRRPARPTPMATPSTPTRTRPPTPTATQRVTPVTRTRAADTGRTRRRVDNPAHPARTMLATREAATHGRGDGGPRTGSRSHLPP